MTKVKTNFYVNMIGKKILENFVDETGVWIKLDNGDLVQLHPSEVYCRV